jgi:hypothetical protein
MMEYIDIIRLYFLLILGHTHHILSILLMRNHQVDLMRGEGRKKGIR